MRAIVSLSPLVVCLLCIATGSHAEGILVGEGHFEFYLDTASLPTGGEETLELLQIAVPSKEVEYREQDGRYRAAVRVKITMRDGEDVVHQKGYVLRDERETPPVSQDLSGFFFLIDSCYVRPGEYVLDIEVEDTQRRKKTLFGLLGKKYISSVIKGAIINIREFPPAEAALGDPILVWSKKPHDGNVEFIPNPMQIYGLKNDTLSFFARARVPGASGADSLDVFVSVVDGAGEVVGEEQFRAAVVGGEAGIFGSFDVNTYPSDTYRLLVEARDREGARISAGKDFSVAWELVNWQKPRRDILVEARIILSDTDYEMFRRMSIGEQESMLSDFWKSADPTPHTALNETYETFIERMRYADSQFGGDVRGSLTDRGRIYIRFGNPDEVVSQSLPKTRNEMTEVLEKLEDQYKVIAFSSQQRGPGAGEYPKIQSRNPSDTRLSDGKPFRGVGMDSGAFELWVYNIRGEPILERDRIMTVQTGFRFLFVDMDGIGEYRLIGTSEELQETE